MVDGQGEDAVPRMRLSRSQTVDGRHTHVPMVRFVYAHGRFRVVWRLMQRTVDGSSSGAHGVHQRVSVRRPQ